MSYKSIHTGQQIDAGVSAALNPDTVPTAGSDALITSGGTKSALDALLNAPIKVKSFASFADGTSFSYQLSSFSMFMLYTMNINSQNASMWQGLNWNNGAGSKIRNVFVASGENITASGISNGVLTFEMKDASRATLIEIPWVLG